MKAYHADKQSLLAKIARMQRHILFWQSMNLENIVEECRQVIRDCRRQIWEMEDGHT